MEPHGRARALQEQRARSILEENQRALARKKGPQDEPGGLAELLNALARGLASIGIRGTRGKGFPAGPAY